MKWHIVFASILIFLMQTYVLNKNYWWSFSPASHPAPRSLLLDETDCISGKFLRYFGDYISYLPYVLALLAFKISKAHFPAEME